MFQLKKSWRFPKIVTITNVLLFLSFSSFSSADIKIDLQPIKNYKIPPANDIACMTRYIVHASDWCSISYISQKVTTFGQPLARTYSISDGTVKNSTGIVYFMVSPMDETVQDLVQNGNSSVIMTLAEHSFCNKKLYDPQDPRCAQAILNGNFIKIPLKSADESYAKYILWSRHPIMKFWYKGVPGHNWFFAKLEIKNIIIIDWFGGRKFPTIEDYFHRNCTKYLKENNDRHAYTVIEEVEKQTQK